MVHESVLSNIIWYSRLNAQKHCQNSSVTCLKFQLANFRQLEHLTTPWPASQHGWLAKGSHKPDGHHVKYQENCSELYGILASGLEEAWRISLFMELDSWQNYEPSGAGWSKAGRDQKPWVGDSSHPFCNAMSTDLSIWPPLFGALRPCSSLMISNSYHDPLSE